MSKTQPNPPSEIRVLVPESVVQASSGRPRKVGTDFEVDSEPFGFSMPWTGKVATAGVPLSQMGSELQKVQEEIEALTATLRPSLGKGFSLDEIQIGVGVSAQGGIAIVSAGVQASLTLLYSRRKSAQ